jgi:hypothetical protein
MANKRRELFTTSDYCAPRRRQRLERSYSRRTKQEVLLFLVHHRIPLLSNGVDEYNKPTRVLKGLEGPVEEGYRRPTTAEAKDYFLIQAESTIRSWWSAREKIFGGNMPTAYPPRWPDLEKELVKQFTTARRAHKIVTIYWFRRMSQQIWDLLYPTELSGVFVFSNGWFWRFLRRYSIVRRRITKVATKQPAEVVHVTNSFI